MSEQEERAWDSAGGTAGAGRPQILAMGGGGFTMRERSPALDRYVLELTGTAVPRVCFLPTASGDPFEQATRFTERFGAWPCEPSILSLFHLGRDRIDPVAHLLAQDAIYVGGGSMRNMLAVWREHGVDAVMREAWSRGVVLAGLSAGAMCWFAGGVTMSGGAPEVFAGLGLLPGSLTVHMSGEPERLPAYREAVASGELPAGYAVDDGGALLWTGRTLTACVGSRPDARVVRMASDGSGGIVEHEMTVRLLPGAETPAGTPGAVAAAAAAADTSDADAFAVSELRALRAGRHRFD